MFFNHWPNHGYDLTEPALATLWDAIREEWAEDELLNAAAAHTMVKSMMGEPIGDPILHLRAIVTGRAFTSRNIRR